MNNLIIVPIYKTNLSYDEIISLKQCFKILGTHEMKFVAPKDLDISLYKDILHEEINVEHFQPEYFKDISGYNRLMLSLEFYKRFQTYDYMLIYQLDCYVFRDEFEYWCQKGFDYIGAPWFDFSFYKKTKIQKINFLLKRFLTRKEENLFSKDILIYNVGNGGFSLRNIKKFTEVLETTDINLLELFRKSNDPKSIYNEDVFWSFFAQNIKKPNYKVASKFSLDLGADIGIRLNSGVLPFGCHAWNKKYNYWKNYISK